MNIHHPLKYIQPLITHRPDVYPWWVKLGMAFSSLVCLCILTGLAITVIWILLVIGRAWGLV